MKKIQEKKKKKKARAELEAKQRLAARGPEGDNRGGGKGVCVGVCMCVLHKVKHVMCLYIHPMIPLMVCVCIHVMQMYMYNVEHVILGELSMRDILHVFTHTNHNTTQLVEWLTV